MLTAGTIAAIILVPLGAAGIALAASLLRKSFKRNNPEDFWIGSGSVALFAIPMFILPIIGLSFVGFNGDYMAYKPTSGTVEQIASRQIADGKGMSERYVFQINGQQYGIDDTRAALIKTGDTVNLNCVKEFVWGSTNNGYACNWG